MATQATRNERTWHNFKTFFQQAYKEQHGFTKTAASGGYQATVNNIFGPSGMESRLPEEEQGHMAEALQAIAEGFETQREEMAQLAQANAMLATTNSTMASQMKDMQAQMECLKEQMTTLQSPGGPSNPSGQQQGGGSRVKVSQAKTSQYKGPWFYCWTHGWYNHPSQRCKFPAPGHKREATLLNRMGGSTERLE